MSQRNHIEASGFFMLRTPLLPFDDFMEWSEGLGVRREYQMQSDPAARDAAWQRDVEILRSRLRAIVQQPDIRHALFVASPVLESSIAYWLTDPDSKKGLQTERSLVRYFARMTGRPTPFGLFAGCSVGTFSAGRDADLFLKSREDYTMNSRLDYQYILDLSASLEADPRVAEGLRYWAAPSLNKIGNFWHCFASKREDTGIAHHLVKIQSEKYLDAAIERARSGATADELAETIFLLSTRSPNAREQANRYARDLIATGFLVSNLSPVVTGKLPLDDLIDQITPLPSVAGVTKALQETRASLGDLDRKGLGIPRQRYEAIAETLGEFSAPIELGRLFQIDMNKPLQKGLLPQAVADELCGAVEFLCRIGSAPPREPNWLRRFREAFSSRYPAAWVPVCQVLDEEAGIGFGSRLDNAPVPADAEIANNNNNNEDGQDPAESTLNEFHSVLLQKVLECAASRSDEIVLDPSDFPESNLKERFVPTGFSIAATVVAPSMAAVQEGEFRVCFRAGIGPSGTVLLGRFAHADPELESHIRQHIREEEKNDPDAIYAEIVYQPQGRVGNIVCRPILRDYEIVCSGRSSSPLERQLPLSDLLITVRGKQILLYSQRLGKRIIPRLTAAHGFNAPTCLPAYQLLGYLQYQPETNVPTFKWGPLSYLPFLPRVRAGRVVLSAARWRISAQESAEIMSLNRRDCFFAVQNLRTRRNLPRWVLVLEGGNLLPVDLDNPLSVDAFVHVLKRLKATELFEMYPAPDQLCITGPEGRFQHELIVPFVRRPQPASAATMSNIQVRPEEVLTVPVDFRMFAPGSEWLYWKLYGGPGILEEILVTVLPPILRHAMAEGAISHWFFLRYSDPHKHLRIRFHGFPGQLTSKVLPLVDECSRKLLSEERVWKVELGTYEREVERYGGMEGLLNAEKIFCADSEAVLTILQTLDLEAPVAERVRIATLGFDRLLADCGFDLAGKIAVIQSGRERLDQEFHMNANVRRKLNERFRADRGLLEELFLATPDSESSSAMQTILKALDVRSASIKPVMDHIHELSRNGRLSRDLSDIAVSYIHMHANRLMRSDPRTHELVVYDYLGKVYGGRCARGN